MTLDTDIIRVIGAVVTGISALIGAVAIYQRWRSNTPHLVVGDWKIHDRREFHTRTQDDILALSWGVTFEVSHGSGGTARLLKVEVSAQGPLRHEPQRQHFTPRTPNVMVSPASPYSSVVYNITPTITRVSLPVARDYLGGTHNIRGFQPCVLLTVTITYRGDGFFGGKRRTESFQGRVDAGLVANTRAWYMRAEQWDASSNENDGEGRPRPGAVLFP